MQYTVYTCINIGMYVNFKSLYIFRARRPDIDEDQTQMKTDGPSNQASSAATRLMTKMIQTQKTTTVRTHPLS